MEVSKNGGVQKCLVYGKSQTRMDDWGYPYFKPSQDRQCLQHGSTEIHRSDSSHFATVVVPAGRSYLGHPFETKIEIAREIFPNS